ncbi:hypothetical protein [Flavobacterium succinicans]|uniref:Long-chain fatty acid transport protein n=1 Tax=Flavobacterium succinicans TaxID=29536 RepID=A0A199XQW5_9FLAO|nr:hypothetical protein [Flavobacterium succinicans]OAZ04040.1 hypothetical protein FLB_17320 [Flavobacterium succinicans]
MIKKIFIASCLLFSLVSLAQQGTSSPYSYYGIGDIRFRGMLENRSMGGVAVEQDSIHINVENPASYASLKNTTLTMGGTYGTKTLKDDVNNATAKRTTLDYMAVAIPIGKAGIGFGLLPYSSVGYKIQSISADGSKNNKRLEGTGGVNKVFFGSGYKVTKNFSLGADVQYNFGKIETDNLEYITDVPVGTRETNVAYVSGLNFNLGAMYQAKITPKVNLYSSVNYTFKGNLTSENTRTISTVDYDGTYDIDPEGFDEVNTAKKLVLPSKLTLGLGFGESRKWMVGAEVAMREAGNLANNYNNVTGVTFNKYSRYSLGGYYIPNYNSFTSYAKRIVYRGGFRFEKTGLMVQNQNIVDKSVTIGFGLPSLGSYSNFNIGLEYGIKGTTAAGLIQENYFNASVSFSLNDKWFVKRKFY